MTLRNQPTKPNCYRYGLYRYERFAKTSYVIHFIYLSLLTQIQASQSLVFLMKIYSFHNKAYAYTPKMILFSCQVMSIVMSPFSPPHCQLFS